MIRMLRFKNKNQKKTKNISTNIETNLLTVKQLFKDVSDLTLREFTLGGNRKCFLMYLKGMADTKQLQDFVMRPLLEGTIDYSRNKMDGVAKLLPLTDVATVKEYQTVVQDVLNGSSYLFIDGYQDCLMIKVTGPKRRSIEEPATEVAIRGPREGFTEDIQTNINLVRARIKSDKLKLISYNIGTETKTNVVISYMDGIIDQNILKEVTKRIENIEIDGILESGYIEELIEDNSLSPFPQIHYSERPDTISAQLLEGQFAIFTDNTPFVLSGPITFGKLMQASEDYYERFFIGTLLRWLRYLFLLIALFLPGIYVAVITYHHDMIPTNLMFSIAAAREPIPFPAIVEVLIMEVSFEALREAGIRLPKTIGQAVSILGALVIGTAAVEAGIVSAPMVIIVSLTGIASFTIPKFNLAISIRMLRFPILFFASILGIFGIVVCTMLIALHLCQLTSFGVPYFSGFAPFKMKEQKDILVRAPWWAMTFRPSTYARGKKRMKRGMQQTPPSREW